MNKLLSIELEKISTLLYLFFNVGLEGRTFLYTRPAFADMSEKCSRTLDSHTPVYKFSSLGKHSFCSNHHNKNFRKPSIMIYGGESVTLVQLIVLWIMCQALRIYHIPIKCPFQ